MFRRSSIMFISAGIVATLAACHQGRPAASPSAAPYQASSQASQPTQPGDRSAREVTGFSASEALPAREFTTTRTTAPVTTPVAAPAAEPADDSQRLFDIP